MLRIVVVFEARIALHAPFLECVFLLHINAFHRVSKPLYMHLYMDLSYLPFFFLNGCFLCGFISSAFFIDSHAIG